MKLLTVTHWSDLFQLQLQAESLRKFWQGRRRWTIVIEDAHPEIAAAHLAWCEQNIHIDDWHIDLVVPHSPNCYRCGWERQQMFKLCYSATADDDWVLVIDTKNYLVKPTNESFFLRESNSIPYLPKFTNNDFFDITTDHAKRMLGVTEDIPPSASMTPWVFNRAATAEMVKLLGIDLVNWPVEKATEFTLYWHWTYSKVNWFPLQFVTGFWNTTYSADDLNVTIKQLSDGVETDPKIVFWTHHRYVTNPVLRQTTVDILYEAGLSLDILNKWNADFDKLLSNAPALRHQEFLKNKQGEDPGFNVEWYQ